MDKVVGEGGIKPLSVAGPPRFSRSSVPNEGQLSGLKVAPPMTYFNSLLPAPCRKCSGPTWKRDEEGAIHPCCELMWTEEGGCLSCRTSALLNREHNRRLQTKVRTGILSVEGNSSLPLSKE